MKNRKISKRCDNTSSFPLMYKNLPTSAKTFNVIVVRNVADDACLFQFLSLICYFSIL